MKTISALFIVCALCAGFAAAQQNDVIVQASGGNPAAGTVAPGTTDHRMLEFKLAVSLTASTKQVFSSLNLVNVSSLGGSGVSQVKLWKMTSAGTTLVSNSWFGTQNGMLLSGFSEPLGLTNVFRITFSFSAAASTGSVFQMRVTPGDVGLAAGSAGGTTQTGGAQTVTDLAITTASPLPEGTEGASYSLSFQSSGGVGAHTWSATGLPQGWTMTAAGLLDGPAGSVLQGSYNFQVAVTDINATTVAGSFAVTVNPPPVISATAPQGTAGVGYSHQFTASGGTQPLSWTATGLPSGWTMSAGGLLTAAASDVFPGAYSLSIGVTDTAGATDGAMVNVTIVPAALVITTTALADLTQGGQYNFTLQATGGTPPFTWQSANLPTGFSLTSSGSLATGVVALQTGSNSFDVTVTDAAQVTQAGKVTFNVLAASQLTILTTTLIDGEVGKPWNPTISADGGVGPAYGFWLDSGALPPGISGLPAVGTPSIVLGGVPTKSGTCTFTVGVQDQLGSIVTQQYTVQISQGGDNSGTGNSGGGCAATGAATLWPVLLVALVVLCGRRRRA